MKILLINHFPLTGSGSGVYTENIANSLTKQGNDVCVIFPENQKPNNYNFKTHPVYFTNDEKIEGAIGFNFPCFTTHPRSTKTFYDLTDEELNIYIDAFKEAIEEEIETFKPDIIHCGHIWLLADIAGSYNIPLIITAHGTDLIGYDKSEKIRKSAVSAAKKAKYIITISKENEKLVEEIYPFAKTIRIPNGYNDEVFYKEELDKNEVLKELGINKSYKNIVSFAGKFTHFKGIDIILKAAKEYQNGDTATILAGNGELFEEMKELAKKLELNNIYFLGNKPHDVLRKLYNIADVSLVPSRKEAFGLVVIEAMACGAPVIGTNDGGIRDIITKDTGILINPEDEKALASNIKKILNKDIIFNRDLIAKYTKEKYAQDNFTKKLLDIYLKAIN